MIKIENPARYKSLFQFALSGLVVLLALQLSPIGLDPASLPLFIVLFLSLSGFIQLHAFFNPLLRIEQERVLLDRGPFQGRLRLELAQLRRAEVKQYGPQEYGIRLYLLEGSDEVYFLPDAIARPALLAQICDSLNSSRNMVGPGSACPHP